MKKPELLSPAGSLNHMRFAYAYGADAVYAGQPRYSLRVRNNEFGKEEVLGKGIEEAHSMGKLFFLADKTTAILIKICKWCGTVRAAFPCLRIEGYETAYSSN